MVGPAEISRNLRRELIDNWPELPDDNVIGFELRFYTTRACAIGD